MIVGKTAQKLALGSKAIVASFLFLCEDRYKIAIVSGANSFMLAVWSYIFSYKVKSPLEVIMVPLSTAYDDDNDDFNSLVKRT